jgi:multidrug resistance efflux pump
MGTALSDVIVEVRVKQGQVVKRGEILCRLDDRDRQCRARAARRAECRGCGGRARSAHVRCRVPRTFRRRVHASKRRSAQLEDARAVGALADSIEDKRAISDGTR